NFAFIGHGEWPFVHARGQAFRRAIEAARHDSMHYYVGTLYDGRKRHGYMNRLRALLEDLPRPCGVLAANDDLGATIVATCISMDLRVPEDIAVLGVDDDEVACEMSEVPLSSIAQPLYAIGYESARMLQRLLLGMKA